MKPGKEIRGEFPVFKQATVDGLEPAFLDSAASAQKPASVISTLSKFLEGQYANIHRGAYSLSLNATADFEKAREKLATYIGAKDPNELIFVKGTTEGVNLIAYTLGLSFSPGDTVLITEIEHHSNIVPWQIIAERNKLNIEFIKIKEDASIDIEDFKSKITSLKPKLVVCSYISNAFGTVLPLSEIITEAKSVGAYVLVDGAQAVPHSKVDVSSLGADFFTFSSHKMYGPTAIGGLWGKKEVLESLPPFQGGGDMIETVSTEGFTLAEIPQKFEAGTPAIAEAVALGAAVDFIENIGIENISTHEAKLFDYAFEKFSTEDKVIVYGPRTTGGEQTSILSFNLEGIHAHDVATFADQKNVQIRSGHHCAMPALKALGLTATARMSFGVYNTEEDIDRLLDVVQFAKKVL